MTRERELSAINRKIGTLEAILLETKEMVKEQHFISSNGTKGLKSMILKKHGLDKAAEIKNSIMARIQNDSELGFPQRKILEFLMDQYDHQKGKFNEINFSKIVKECRLGKNKAKGYLDYLVKKGYIKKRDDGYRVWYGIP